ncbi:hypothetical protein B0H13DRAFT_2319641 [Mycena leptocephala]|nr:hypothetical protein B0H13DRAFT_2319641 [Mycena leptocephala]
MTSVADLKHDDEVLRHGGISHLAARIKGDAARGASHGVMDVEDVHGVYCSGVTIPEPGTGSASCPHRYASLHHLLAIQGICGEVLFFVAESEAYVRYGTGLTAKKDAEVKIMLSCTAHTRRHLTQQDRVDVVSAASSPHLLLDNAAREPHIYPLAALLCARCPTATPFHTHPLDTTLTRTIPRRALPRSHSAPPTSFLSPTAQRYPARSLRARVPRICAARHQSHAHRFARGFIVPGATSIVPPSPLDACASARPLPPTVSPFAHVAFSASSQTMILVTHPPSMPAWYTPRYDDTRSLQRPRPPFLVSHPTVVARGEPVHARSNMPRTSAPFAAPCNSAPFRECASARAREGFVKRLRKLSEPLRPIHVWPILSPWEILGISQDSAPFPKLNGSPILIVAALCRMRIFFTEGWKYVE